MPTSTTTPLQSTDQSTFEDALRAFQSTPADADTLPPGREQVREGLGLSELDDVVEALDLDQSALHNVLGISVRTLQRRRKQQQDLTATESDRLWRLLHIWQQSRRALASDEAARTWLKTPHGLLGGETPLERLDTEPGLREVEDLLTTIDETGAA